MKTVISACLIAATLAVAILPANAAGEREFSSQEEHREYHRERVLNNR